MTRSKEPHKIMITGGHITPAIATIDEIKKRHPLWTIIFVGRTVALEDSNTVSEEYRIITSRKIKFLPLITGRFNRNSGYNLFVSLAKTVVGFFQSLWYVFREKPECIMSFGGYIAVPVTLAGWMCHVPVITHEQTRRLGKANEFISQFATRLCVSFPVIGNTNEALRQAIYTGLPIREEVLHPSGAMPKEFTNGNKPIILILGGATGAASLNTIVFKTLAKLLSDFTVIHQVGRESYDAALAIKKGLQYHRASYIPVPYLSERAYSWALHHAGVIVSRSGANTVAEIAATGNVAVFVPLPWAARNEQHDNAGILEKHGSIILDQSTITSVSFFDTILALYRERESRREQAAKFIESMPKDGAANLVTVIDDVLHIR